MRSFPVKISFFLSLTCLLLVTGCLSKKDRVSKIWFYTFSEPGTKSDTLLSPASFLLLSPDGTYARDFGSFDNGTWTITDKQLMLTTSSGQKFNYPYTGDGIHTITLSLKDAEKAVFESMRIPGKDDGLNPFVTELNTWRIPATQKEGREAIRKRMLDHCRFWEAYFSWALKNQLSTVDVRSTPTNIKIYGNGFGLKPVSELPTPWKRYFFDEDDCALANAEIANIFQTKNIAWAKTDNKYKMFIAAFQQMQQYLR